MDIIIWMTILLDYILFGQIYNYFIYPASQPANQPASHLDIDGYECMHTCQNQKKMKLQPFTKSILLIPYYQING